MAALTPQTTAVVGTTLTSYNPTVTVGDTVPIGAKLIVHNASGGSINVTIQTPGNDQYGLARPDIVTAVGPGAKAQFGPMAIDLGDPANSNLVTFVCSAVASVTCHVVT